MDEERRTKKGTGPPQFQPEPGAAEMQPGHEKTDAEIRPIIIFIVSLGIFIVVAMFAMSWMLSFMESRNQAAQREISPLADQEQIPPEPRLQANPALDMEAMQRREEELLNSYQWIDQNAGTFRIPVERAMEIIAENGLPSRTPAEVEQEGTQAGDAPSSDNREGSR